jgi:hypothetical protein
LASTCALTWVVSGAQWERRSSILHANTYAFDWSTATDFPLLLPELLLAIYQTYPFFLSSFECLSKNSTILKKYDGDDHLITAKKESQIDPGTVNLDCSTGVGNN